MIFIDQGSGFSQVRCRNMCLIVSKLGPSCFRVSNEFMDKERDEKRFILDYPTSEHRM